MDKSLLIALDGVRALPKRCQITKHRCIQGWTDIAEWEGAAARHPGARQATASGALRRLLVLWPRTEGKPFDEALTLEQATHEQTILAYRMNDQPLSVEHGAPLRLRCETVLGYKMVKWLCRIELVADFASVARDRVARVRTTATTSRRPASDRRERKEALDPL